MYLLACLPEVSILTRRSVVELTEVKSSDFENKQYFPSVWPKVKSLH